MRFYIFLTFNYVLRQQAVGHYQFRNWLSSIILRAGSEAFLWTITITLTFRISHIMVAFKIGHVAFHIISLFSCNFCLVTKIEPYFSLWTAPQWGRRLKCDRSFGQHFLAGNDIDLDSDAHIQVITSLSNNWRSSFVNRLGLHH